MTPTEKYNKDWLANMSREERKSLFDSWPKYNPKLTFEEKILAILLISLIVVPVILIIKSYYLTAIGAAFAILWGLGKIDDK